MKKIVAPVGAVFGRLTVLGEGERAGTWLVQCSCQSPPREIRKYSIIDGLTQSCGCLAMETKRRPRTHGKSNARIYQVWAAMRSRCENPSDNGYPDYGGRGITVCDRWKDFANFYADMGDPPKGYWLDRVDNAKGYDPDNCAWRTPKQQNRNRRDNNLLTYNGETLCLSEWAEKLGISRDLLRGRVRRGWDVERIFNVP